MNNKQEMELKLAAKWGKKIGAEFSMACERCRSQLLIESGFNIICMGCSGLSTTWLKYKGDVVKFSQIADKVSVLDITFDTYKDFLDTKKWLDSTKEKK